MANFPIKLLALCVEVEELCQARLETASMAPETHFW